MIRPLTLGLLLLALPVHADYLSPARTIRAKAVIAAEDLVMQPADMPGALSDPAQVVGQEARIALFPGRPIRPGDIGPPALIERNDIVSVSFRSGGLVIVTEGRALGRGGSGDVIRVMNLSSRSTVSGRIRDDGSVEVR